MITRGSYRTTDNSTRNTLVVKHEKGYLEVFLGDIKGNLLSAYKRTNDFEGSYINNKAKDLAKIINMGVNGCTSKNGSPVPFDLGASSKHSFKKSNINFDVERFNDELCNAFITSENFAIELEYCRERIEFPEIPYVRITTTNSVRVSTDGTEDIPVRTLEEISLEKDITWLRNKQYYIVNDEETAEKIFSALDNYNSVISFDTETTGLRINMFGQIGSPKKKEIEAYNAELKAKDEDPLRVDRLVGFIYCVERDVSYYFPCFNRKFKNLYNDVNNPVTKKVVDRILADYTIGKYRDRKDYMAEFIRNTPPSEWGSDVILMERNRNILETKILLAHNGTFEWKVCWLYNIDFNLKEDTIILHQLMYKFRSTTSNRGEPSNLKYLSKVELGVDQLELTDFFSGFEEDKGGTVKGSGKSRKKKKAIIDFSYMDYDGSRAYAPADGDLTFQLFLKYKSDMLKNHRELEYLYQVEILVSCAIAYMEFYGHRIDEDKIENIRKNYISEKLELELKIRDMIGYSDENEKKVHEELDSLNAQIKELDNKVKTLKESKSAENDINDIKNKRTELYNQKEKLQEKVVEAIGGSSKELNLASPQQVANLFFDELGYPAPEEKKSVSKKVIKGLIKQKNSDGTAKCPVAKLYSDWKNVDTLLTKFFDNLPDFMYPGGFIFSSYGQISTATGRMSCNKPNAQQYPKTVTKIVSPRPGYIMIDADFSQIEYRTLVAMANEPDLLEKFNDPDMDYHTTMASLMYSVPYAAVTPKMRGDAKSFNFGIPYGMGFGSLAILLTGLNNESTRKEAMEKYELYFKDQPNVRMFFNDVKEFALVNKYTETKWHRRRYYSFEDKDGNFSQKKKAMALRQAGNAIIQGTAADIFKIAVARNFAYIRKNGLLGQLLIVNMIHDEQLMEVNCETLNVKKVLSDVICNMEMKLAGFPPLYVGAGVGVDWADAKGKMAEIHPLLGEQYIHESQNDSIWSDKANKPEDVLAYFNQRVLEFRTQKIIDYVKNPVNYNQPLHPVIGNLLGLQFDYGVNKEYEKEYTEDNGYSKDEIEAKKAEIPLEQLRRFLEDHGLGGIDINLFKDTTLDEDEEEDKEYTDGDEDEDIDPDGDVYGGTFALIDEDPSLYGIAIQDIIAQFGLLVSTERKICGIDLNILPMSKKDELFQFLEDNACEDSDEGSMEVVFLMSNNILKRTGVYVKGINGNSVATKFKINPLIYK